MKNTDDEPRAELETRLCLAIARSLRELDGTEVSLVRQSVGKALEWRRLLRTVALDNDDAPAHAFEPAPWSAE